ncbi:hypothetical protein D3C78_1131530 [compost metagenome]
MACGAGLVFCSWVIAWVTGLRPSFSVSWVTSLAPAGVTAWVTSWTTASASSRGSITRARRLMPTVARWLATLAISSCRPARVLKIGAARATCVSLPW